MIQDEWWRTATLFIGSWFALVTVSAAVLLILQ